MKILLRMWRVTSFLLATCLIIPAVFIVPLFGILYTIKYIFHGGNMDDGLEFVISPVMWPLWLHEKINPAV